MSAHDPLLDSVPGPRGAGLEDTIALLARARDGDASAANEIFARYDERIRRIVRVRLGPGLRRWTESGDVVQEICRSALESLDALEVTSELDLLDWLSRVATHRIRDLADYVHAEKRDLARAVPLAASNKDESSARIELADSRTTPSERVFRLEVRALLDEIVASLPESYREVVLLRDYHGAEWSDIARLLATPSVHAAQQLHQRAWIKVRAIAVPRLAGLRRE